MFKLDKKSVIVTGGSSGIGKAIALLFAKQGASVFIFDIDEKGTQAAIEEITSEGGIALGNVFNITDQQQVRNAVQEVTNKIGSINILVCSAGIPHIGTAETTTEEDFTRIFNINVKGVYNSLHEVIPVMKKQNKGVILNICSVAASVGIPDRFAYSMSKGAVLAMTLTTAKDFILNNIRCNCISPARIYTPFVKGFIAKNYPGKEQEVFDKLSKTQPIGRMGTPEEVAHFALYLCSDEAGFLTGCDYPIDGGFVNLNT
jgi:NAD(P)-dependent dehydrogenase (short-subunit alcohol dehydrogenase family)